jgi:hypothetical protein
MSSYSIQYQLETLNELLYNANNNENIAVQNRSFSNSVKISYIPANKLFNYHQYDENKDGKNIECSICLNVVKKKSMIVKMGCGHYFHKACLFNWIDISKKTFCPNCRYDEF